METKKQFILKDLKKVIFEVTGKTFTYGYFNDRIGDGKTYSIKVPGKFTDSETEEIISGMDDLGWKHLGTSLSPETLITHGRERRNDFSGTRFKFRRKE